jgi:hypothetical protein
MNKTSLKAAIEIKLETLEQMNQDDSNTLRIQDLKKVLEMVEELEND